MYYLIEPKCHGNGGWYGQKIIAEEKDVRTFLNSSPYKFGFRYLTKEEDNEVFICLTQDINSHIFSWMENEDTDGKEWVVMTPIFPPEQYVFGRYKPFKLNELNLGYGVKRSHPNIKTDGTLYVARIKGNYYMGKFFGDTTSSLSFNKGSHVEDFCAPGYNDSRWEALWEVEFE